jgi:hypothetical protein
VRLPDKSLDAALQPVAKIDIHSCPRVGLLHGNSCRATASVANRFPQPAMKIPETF